jgi:nitrite reductase/ring-hydroxylating ferredoxin subunit
MTIIRKIFGTCKTTSPNDDGSWQYSKGKIVIEWARVPELQQPGGAIRLEGRGLKEKIILIYGIDGQYHAFKNEYSRLGMPLDPVEGKAKIRCCGLFETIFDYSGNVMSGKGKESLKTYRVETRKCKLVIWV